MFAPTDEDEASVRRVTLGIVDAYRALYTPTPERTVAVPIPCEAAVNVAGNLGDARCVVVARDPDALRCADLAMMFGESRRHMTNAERVTLYVCAVCAEFVLASVVAVAIARSPR